MRKIKRNQETKGMRMNLQFFAEPAGTEGNGSAGAGTAGTPPVQPPASNQQQQSAIQVDYEKLAQIVAGKQTATEESVLRGYFKQQGLSKEEVDQAIATFKQQKAASQPDVNALQTQAAQAQAMAQQAIIEKEATLTAISLGLDAKTIPYVLKMADLSQVTGQDGKVNAESMKNAINKVLEDVPALKPQAAGTTGFIQVGASGGSSQQTNNDEALKKAFGL